MQIYLYSSTPTSLPLTRVSLLRGALRLRRAGHLAHAVMSHAFDEHLTPINLDTLFLMALALLALHRAQLVTAIPQLVHEHIVRVLRLRVQLVTIFGRTQHIPPRDKASLRHDAHLCA